MKKSLFGPFTPLFFDYGPCKPRYCPFQRPFVERQSSARPEVIYQRNEDSYETQDIDIRRTGSNRNAANNTNSNKNEDNYNANNTNGNRNEDASERSVYGNTRAEAFPDAIPEKKDPVKVLIKLDCPRCCEKEECRCEPKCCCEPKCRCEQRCCCDCNCCCSRKCCCDHDCCCRKRKCCCCDNDKCCGKNKCCCDSCGAVSNSATGGAGPLPIIVAGDLTAAIPVVSVSIDTCCLCDPSVVLNFTTQISLPAASTTTLVFQVLRSGPCNGTTTSVGSSFTYTNAVIAATSDSFSFQVFDNDLRRGTYTYSVVLTTGTTATVAGVTLVNSTLSAHATSD